MPPCPGSAWRGGDELERRVPGELLPDTGACFSLLDTVAFGEVVTQPPTITSRPRGRGPAEQVSCGGRCLPPLGRTLGCPQVWVGPGSSHLPWAGNQAWKGSGGLSLLVTVPQSPVLAFSSFVLPDLSRLCPQAGRKRLLLTSRLGRSQASPESPAAPVSMARRRIVEEERARVIQAYRDIQRRKQQQREAAAGSARAGRRVPR